jgi:hypothetical protein
VTQPSKERVQVIEHWKSIRTDVEEIWAVATQMIVRANPWEDPASWATCLQLGRKSPREDVGANGVLRGREVESILAPFQREKRMKPPSKNCLFTCPYLSLLHVSAES